jgi:YidC/Oxa1 family membrane protein insertase
MDKTGIIVVSICVVLLGWWYVEQSKYAQQRALYEQTHPVAVAPSRLDATNASTASLGAPTTASTASLTAATPTVFDTSAPEQVIVLTNGQPHQNWARYTFTSRGGGLKLVELLDFPSTLSIRWKGRSDVPTNAVASLNTQANVPVLAVVGDPSLVGDGIFTLTRIPGGVRAEKTLPGGLRLVKEFQPGSNYLVYVNLRLENPTDKPLVLPAQEVVVGTATPMDADDNGYYVNALWSDGATYTYNGTSYFNTNTSILGFFPHTPKSEFRGGAGNVAWAASENQYFALLAMPKDPAQEFVARAVALPPVPGGSIAPPIGIQSALVYPAQTLTANSSVERDIVVFAGPKEYRRLAQIGEEFHNRADLAMNFGTGYLSFWGVGTFFAKLLLSGMNWLHDFTRMGYGWTIVVITIILRAMFWPLTAASTRSMKRMQALKPEIDALKEKYKDDQQKFTQKQMELWKKHKINPMSGCLPMVVQMPVFFGFLAMIRCAIELRGAHFLWVADLTKPDILFMIPGVTFIPFLSTAEGLPFNLLPLLMVGTMIWQAHLMPASPSMDASQQKMMRYMPLMMLAFLYNYSSGMALYMTVSTLLSGIQTKLTKIMVNQPGPAGPAVNPALTPAPKRKK